MLFQSLAHDLRAFRSDLPHFNLKMINKIDKLNLITYDSELTYRIEAKALTAQSTNDRISTDMRFKRSLQLMTKVEGANDEGKA